MKTEKRYIVRKFIMATSIQDAVKKEKKKSPDEIFLDLPYLDLQENKKIGYDSQTKSKNS